MKSNISLLASLLVVAEAKDRPNSISPWAPENTIDEEIEHTKQMLADLNEWLKESDNEKKAIDAKVEEIKRQEKIAHEHEQQSHKVEHEQGHSHTYHEAVHEPPTHVQHEAVVKPVLADTPGTHSMTVHEIVTSVHHPSMDAPHIATPEPLKFGKAHIPQYDHHETATEVHHHSPTHSMYSHQEPALSDKHRPGLDHHVPVYHESDHD